MDLKSRPWSPSSILLVIAGILLVCTGLYFIFLRPPLLPEDVRYMGLTSAELQLIGPRLGSWLTHVFFGDGRLHHGNRRARHRPRRDFVSGASSSCRDRRRARRRFVDWLDGCSQLHDWFRFQVVPACDGSCVGVQLGLVWVGVAAAPLGAYRAIGPPEALSP
jgi:hypothetical protein